MPKASEPKTPATNQTKRVKDFNDESKQNIGANKSTKENKSNQNQSLQQQQPQQQKKSNNQISSTSVVISKSNQRNGSTARSSSSSSSSATTTTTTTTTVITENELPLHLEDRSSFSTVVTPEVQENNATPRSVDFDPNDHISRTLFATTFMTSVRLVAFRIFILFLIIFGIYYHDAIRSRIGFGSSAVISQSTSHTGSILSPSLTHTPSQTHNPQVILDEDLGRLAGTESIIRNDMEKVSNATITLHDQVNEAVAISRDLEARVQTAVSSIADREQLQQQLHTLQEQEEAMGQAITALTNAKDEFRTEQQSTQIEVNMLSVEPTLASEVEIDENVLDEPLEAFNEERLQGILSSVEETIENTSIEKLESIGTLDESGNPRSLPDRIVVDKIIDDRVREQFRKSRSLILPSEMIEEVIATNSPHPMFDDMTLTLTRTGDLHSSNPQLTNHAASSRGGRVVTDDIIQQDIRLTSPPVIAKRGPIKNILLKLKLINKDSEPQVILNEHLPIDQGSRYCIAGGDGQITVILRHPVKVSAVSLFNPIVGNTLNDPTVIARSVRVIGWTSNDHKTKSDVVRYELGIYRNDKLPSLSDGENKEMIQRGGDWVHFNIPSSTPDGHEIPPLRAITFAVLSNHGNEEKTCVYRVQVLGVEQHQNVLSGSGASSTASSDSTTTDSHKSHDKHHDRVAV